MLMQLVPHEKEYSSQEVGSHKFSSVIDLRPSLGDDVPQELRKLLEQCWMDRNIEVGKTTEEKGIIPKGRRPMHAEIAAVLEKLKD